MEDCIMSSKLPR